MEDDDEKYNQLIEEINDVLREIQILNFGLMKKLKILKAKKEKENEENKSRDEEKDEEGDDLSSLIKSPPKTIHKSASSLPEHLKVELGEGSMNTPLKIKELAIQNKKEIDELLTNLQELKKKLLNFKTNAKLPEKEDDEEEEPPLKKQKIDGRKSKSKRRRSKSKRRKSLRKSAKKLKR